MVQNVVPNHYDNVQNLQYKHTLEHIYSTRHVCQLLSAFISNMQLQWPSAAIEIKLTMHTHGSGMLHGPRRSANMLSVTSHKSTECV